VKLVEIAFSTGARRRPEGWLGRMVAVYAAGTALWVVYAATYALIDVLALTIIFLTLMLVLVFLTVGATPGADRRRPPIHDLLLAGVSAVTGLYFMVNAEAIANRMTLLDPLTTFDTVFATILLILTLETTRRTVGLGLTLIVSLFVVYNLFGDRFTGALNHGVISTQHFLDIMVFTTDGIFGVPLRVAGTYVFLFVMFGTFLSRAGGSEFFFNLAAALSGRSPGGPAKIAVVSSGLYGTISGSPTSDVVTTGSVTIPMMQRLGYSGALAGGVEVAASTGGSLLPPVMGSAAFIMAEYTGIDYVDIVIAALLPALLYYLCIYAQVHLRSLKMGLQGLPEENIPTLSRALRQGGVFLVPLAVVILALIEGYSPTFVAVFGALSVLVVSWFRRDTRLGPKAVFESLAETSLRMVSVTGACAAAGLVIGGITMTGLAAKFSHLVFFMAGSHSIRRNATSRKRCKLSPTIPRRAASSMIASASEFHRRSLSWTSPMAGRTTPMPAAASRWTDRSRRRRDCWRVPDRAAYPSYSPRRPTARAAAISRSSLRLIDRRAIARGTSAPAASTSASNREPRISSSTRRTPAHSSAPTLPPTSFSTASTRC
jgi:TRAP transporter 4TM/12TM fusion protein